jgi:hypothetical protein
MQRRGIPEDVWVFERTSLLGGRRSGPVAGGDYSALSLAARSASTGSPLHSAPPILRRSPASNPWDSLLRCFGFNCLAGEALIRILPAYVQFRR